MTDPSSQSFQHLLHNKPAKVNYNLKSFQTYFTFDKNFFSQQYYFFDSLTSNSYDVCSRFFNAKFIQNFNRSIKLSIYQFKKQADESIVKKNTLTLLNGSRTYEVSIKLLTIRGTPMSRTYKPLNETYANHPSNEKC